MMPIVTDTDAATHAGGGLPPVIEPTSWPWRPAEDPRLAWQRWALETASWLQGRGVDVRDALVTVPMGAVLPLARQAWAEAVGGWLPRIDTVAGLVEAASWDGPERTWPAASESLFGAPLTLDVIQDRLQAARSLGGQAWARQWARRDRRGYEFALDQVVEAAQTWVRALQAVSPGQRAARVEGWRERMQAHVGQAGDAGPGGRERLLLAWALEWAGASADAGLAMDVVHGLRPSAWVAVTAGPSVAPGSEVAVMLAAIRQAAARGCPVRWVCAEVPAGAPGGPTGDDVSCTVTPCTDVLDEARQAAAWVIEAVNVRRAMSLQGSAPLPPVALLALDRSVVRHVRALLEGADLHLADETGWKLSTTRAASVCTRLVAAANPRAATDELLDWLKSGWIAPPSEEGGLFTPSDADLVFATSGLEQWCRRQGLLSAWTLPADLGVARLEGESTARHGRMPEAGRLLWTWAQGAVGPLQVLWRAPRASLWQWLSALHRSLMACGAATAMQADAAGALAWQTLMLDAVGQPGEQPGPLYESTRMDGPAFMRWLGEVFESVTFRPPAEGPRPDVVITTLARSVLRPFHAIVVPGADERQLGALGAPGGWLGTRLREDMGLATPAQTRQAQWEAFQLMMTRSRVHVLHRRAQGSEPLEVSAWLARWSAHSGVPVAVSAGVSRTLSVEPTPVRPPAPSLSGAALALPERLSATQYDVLRQCPYRFFATVLLRLREQDELEEGLAHSDLGSWLHAVLQRFHIRRERQHARPDADAEVAAWLDVAREVAQEMGLLHEGQRPFFQPHQATLPDLARAYVSWLLQHEAQGWSLRACELPRERVLDLSDERVPRLLLKLVGQIDRVDVGHADGRSTQFVLDYKTSSGTTLRQRAASEAEDTQLAFYALLSDAADDTRAAYVHLDARKVEAIEHPQVEGSAQALLQGIGEDWRRLHMGAAMPALGEGKACEHCAVRGLCRRDHWTDEEATA